MPKLLQVTTTALTLRAFLQPLARHFRAQGWRVDALAGDARACAACRAAFDGVWDVPWSRRPAELTNVRAVVEDVRALVEREGYDVVHVHTPIAAFLTRFALRGLRKAGRPRVIYTAHGFHFYPGGSPVRNLTFRLLERLAGRWTDYLVVINREDEAAAKRYGLVPPERVRYMPGIGIDLEGYRPDRVTAAQVAAVRASLDLPAEAVLLLMVAEFNPGKRHRDALQALAALARPDVHLAFAGTGPLLEPSRQQAAALGLAGQVHFLGFRDDVPVLMRAARATVLPSAREGLPRSVMESLALEVPVLGTRIRGMRELVPPACGRLVDVGDAAALSAAMGFVADHGAEAAEMGRAGRRHMATFDLAHVLALHETLYREALAAR